MVPSSRGHEPIQDDRHRHFATTRWSLIRAAADPTTDEARQALEDLCCEYWPPVYAYLRRRGYETNDAEDLVQGFFAFVLDKGVLAKTDPARGRFRSFLLAVLKNYLSHHRDHAQAQKRGGGRTRLPIDFQQAEQRFLRTPGQDTTPEAQFERQWALTLLEHVRNALHQQACRAGKGQQFLALWPLVARQSGHDSSSEIARKLGMSEVALRVAVHRLRSRFGKTLRAEIAQTVESEHEVQAELEQLFHVLRQ